MKWLAYLLLGMIGCPAPAWATSPEARLRAANAALEAAWLAEDAAALRAHYAADAVVMPEHSVARRGGDEIEAYFSGWFTAVDVKGYRRSTDDIRLVGTHAVEIGQFEQRFARQGAKADDYRGKYMAVWAMDGEEPKLVAELWGADAPFDRAMLPEIAPMAGKASASFKNDPSLTAEINARNALIDTLVTERRGAEHASLFLPDAAYLTYYTPTRQGMDQIRDYFVEHEKPGDVSIEALDLGSGKLRVLARDDVVLEEGFYRVAWRAGEANGVVRGKSLNLWKRDGDGEFKLFRQAVNHD